MNMKMALDVPYSWLTRENNQIQYEVLITFKPIIWTKDALKPFYKKGVRVSPLSLRL